MKQTIHYASFIAGVGILTHIIILFLFMPTELLSQNCQADVHPRSKWLKEKVAIKETPPQKNTARISVFPNPVIEQLIVGFGEKRIIEKVSVYNVSGKLVHLIEKHSADSSITIDTSGLPIGFYSVQLVFQKGDISCCSFIKII